MRADFLFFGLDRTGGVLCMLRYLIALQAAGDETSITTLGSVGDPRFVEPPPGVRTIYVGLRSKPYKALVRISPGGLGFPQREIQRLAAASRTADLRVVSYALTIPAAQEAGGPVYAHVQHFDPLIVAPGRARDMARAAYSADIYRTANCTWVAEQTAEAGGRVEGIITPGIDLDVFQPGDSLAGPVGPLRILTLGKAAEWKGLRDVVAAARLLAEDRSVELISYGPDQPTGDLGRARLVHHGFVGSAHLADLYRTSTVCVSASWYESFPLPPLEAMACGTPAICTRLGTEDYADNGVNCLIVQPRDPEAIAAAVRLVADDTDLRRELASNGLETAARFTWPEAGAAFVHHARAAAGAF